MAVPSQKKVRPGETTAEVLLHMEGVAARDNEVEPQRSVAGQQKVLHYTMPIRGNLILIELWVNNNGTFSALFSHGPYTLQGI
ncbi:hypothetical protein N5P37_010934 [Trichoderma harzianum]|nr:hypothetical protein N5P37_010934 [Trichoderma harzianum]